MSFAKDAEQAYDWRGQRKAGMVAIIGSGVVFTALWLAVRHYAPIPGGMHDVVARLVFALKCCCLATLFCFATGIDAVAHERLQSAAFDPLRQIETRRLRVNLRYLQNTLEQLVMFAVGLFGLAVYSPDGEAMRTVVATTVVWIAARLAYWAGYHHGAAMRGLGIPGLALSLLVLVYVAGRIGFDLAGSVGAVVVVGVFLVFEAFLFRATRSSQPA